MALCEKPVSDSNKLSALLNPAVIFEVLSGSTEETDKGKKIEEYLNLPSVPDYLLIAQERVSVVHWNKQADGQWRMDGVYAILRFSHTGVCEHHSYSCRHL